MVWSVQVVGKHLHFGTLRCRLGGSVHPIAYFFTGSARSFLATAKKVITMEMLGRIRRMA